MIAADVQALVDSEIGGDWSRTNDHGVDLRHCLVKPQKVVCRNTFPKLQGGKPLELWIVLEETPGKKDGYLIVFDESRRKFGLAVWDADVPVFLGFHGSFLDALMGM